MSRVVDWRVSGVCVDTQTGEPVLRCWTKNAQLREVPLKEEALLDLIQSAAACLRVLRERAP